MEKEEKNCCFQIENSQNKGIFPGVLYGLLPHSFCIAFVLFSVIGAATATAFLKKFLLVPYAFHFLVFISLVLATVSAVIYLRKTSCLCASGIRNKWKYLATLYSTTILANLFIFFVVFPVLANMSSENPSRQENLSADLSISVEIPCSGHASLIIDELKKGGNVQTTNFKLPNTFEIKYNPEETSPEKIMALEIFKTYKAKIN